MDAESLCNERIKSNACSYEYNFISLQLLYKESSGKSANMLHKQGMAFLFWGILYIYFK